MYPKLRFKGFDDAWEQRKLSDIGNIITGSTPSTKDKNNYNGDFLFVSPADIQGNRFVEKTITTLSELGFKKGRILAPKSTLFVSIGSTIGKVAQIRDFAVTNQQINSIEPFKDIDPDFVFSLMQKESPSIRCLSATQAVPILNKTTFSNVEVSIASNINEQYRIGELFIKLDSTITLHQRQCEALKKQKRFFLQNMFPKEGESEPRIRFNGFTEPWEQRKCKTLCSISTGKSNTQDQVDDGEYPFFIRSDKAVKSNKYLYDEEAVITIGDGNIGKVFHYVNGKFDLHQRCYKMTNFIDVTAKYFYYYFSKNFYKRAMSMTAKATVDSVRLEMIADMDIQFPTDMSEQKLIADYFSNLDNLITLHQRQYEQLVSLKKYLLSKMFI